MSDYRVEQIRRKAISWPEQERKHFGAEELHFHQYAQGPI
jgi:hypothetical protein